MLRRLALTVLTMAGLSAGSNQSASAADMPIKGMRAAPVVMYTWNGFYIGANGGYGWGTSNWSDDPALGLTDLGGHRTPGGFAGGTLGYNWQIGMTVFGIEGDFAWANLKGNHVDLALHELHTKVSSIGTITGRIGFAYWTRTLIYVKAGGAWGKFNYDDFVTAGGALNGSSSGSRWGWALGGGIEYALAANWSAKVEYNYLDFNAKRMGFSGGAAGGYTQDVNQNVQLLRLGVNYRFGP